MVSRFLLAQLHFNILINAESEKALKTALERLTTGSATDSEAYDSAYKDAIERIEQQAVGKMRVAKRVLAWITCAKRPLTTSELREAIAVEIGTSKLDAENYSEIDYLVSVCAGLVTVDKRSKIIRLIHYTAQEFLERTQQTWFSEDAQALITKVCTTYLSFTAFEDRLYTVYRGDRDGHPHVYHKTKHSSYQHFRACFRAYELLEYAAFYWGYHAYQAPSAHAHVMKFLQRPMNVATSGAVSDWDISMTGLHVAARFGLDNAVLDLLKISHKPNVRSHHKETPLMIASRHGHKSTAKLLLEHKANVNLQGNHLQTALHRAAKYGREEVVQLLLQNNAIVTVRNVKGRTALHEAVRYQHSAVVSLLLRDTAAIDDAMGIRGDNPLRQAIYNGDLSVTKLLLNAGAKINGPYGGDDPPLYTATQEGYETLVQFLLNQGADVDCQCEDGCTPLIGAVLFGHEFIAEILLSYGANINLQDKKGRSALLTAIQAEGEAMYTLLLKRGADVNILCAKGRTPLFTAARKWSCDSSTAIPRCQRQRKCQRQVRLHPTPCCLRK